MEVSKEKFPKIIWLFWYQGIDEAPELVKICVQSWQIRNPDYEIRLLDKTSITHYITETSSHLLERADISFQLFSDYLRLTLLKNYGGVWIDATVYCFQPLSKWFNEEEYFTTGIFLFSNPYADRLIASWLIAAQPRHYIITTWLDRLEQFLNNHRFNNQNNTLGQKMINIFSRFFNRNIESTQYWMSFIPTKLFRIYPYHILHYIFNYLYLKDEYFKEIWQKTKQHVYCKYSIIYRKKNHLNFEQFLLLKAKQQLPLFKLSNKIDMKKSIYHPYWEFIKKDFYKLVDGKGSQSN